MSDLERRYRRLLWTYPADYRRERGAEIIGTYLDLAGPGRRRPSIADAADLARGGLRQRLRAAGAGDLVPGVRLAAVLALTAGATLAGAWAAAERHPLPADLAVPQFGPFATIGVLAWVGWLLAILALAVRPGRWARATLATAVALTVALVPVGALTGLPRPPLLVLLPQVALGLVALGLPDRPSTPARYAPLLGAVTAALLIGRQVLGDLWGYYRWGGLRIMPVVGAALFVAGVLVGGALLRRHRNGLWVPLALGVPVGLLTLRPLVLTAASLHGYATPTWSTFAAAAVLVTVVGLVGFTGALLAAGRRRSTTVPATRPTR
ncbi:hypothetical protein ACFO0M_30585 [Micromonospora mangrovi]|uniref:Integral membrane protein n=2 Tax=Micromonospora TaxID=1873 RepID=A0AAU7M9H1_9ACTN